MAIVLVIAVYVSDQTEQNTIATAARLGATNTSAEIGILNQNITPIRVEKIDMTSGDNIDVTIYLSNSDLSESQKQSILLSVQQAIESEGYTVQNMGNNLTISTSRHNYLIGLA
ncbi:hypothetical protein GCM10025860_18800 [Methanobacterium ferruginis]|nr:class III signal peptide-containing protein [Methanobacterium ferruginis]BDZ68432.1 hypothetical protein GCM10025860_18800 [Methanobacterium ferruginis]